jgi:hypothetical protein
LENEKVKGANAKFGCKLVEEPSNIRHFGRYSGIFSSQEDLVMARSKQLSIFTSETLGRLLLNCPKSFVRPCTPFARGAI